MDVPLITLPAWTKNIGKRLIKSQKIYLADCGLAAHLSGFGMGSGKTADAFKGPLLECFVVSELRKQASWGVTPVELYHYRTTSGREVDIVMEDASGRLAAIEIKAAASVSRRDFSGIKSFAEATGDQFVQGAVLYTGDQVVSFGEKKAALPVSVLWD